MAFTTGFSTNITGFPLLKCVCICLYVFILDPLKGGFTNLLSFPGLTVFTPLLATGANLFMFKVGITTFYLLFPKTVISVVFRFFADFSIFSVFTIMGLTCF